MFPAHAGMNRQKIVPPNRIDHVPRARGDEPMSRLSLVAPIRCSPRTRG